MRSLIRYVTRKSRGGVAVRDEVVEGEKILAGRGNDCGIHLPDPRVMLHHAEFSARGGTLFVSAAAGADIRVDDNLTSMAKIGVGSRIRVGPYEIVMQEASEGFELTLAVELVQALGDDLDKLIERSRIHISGIGLSMRAWAWVLVGVVFLGTFAVPLAMNILTNPLVELLSPRSGRANYVKSPTGVWTSGSISGAHKFFGESCETCHEAPFVPVRDNACVNCHSKIQNHAEPALFPLAGLTDRSCQSCHKEHQGGATIVLDKQDFCITCHSDMGRSTIFSTLGNATDFGSNHPELRPSVVTDPVKGTKDRTRLVGGNPPPQENSGLKFPHDRHLRLTGVRDPARGNVVLQCVDCHKPSEGGESMLPISFERNCHSCHDLKFDAFVPNRELAHGKPAEVFRQVYDVYDALAMRGGYEEPAAPPVLRRIPGAPLTPVEKTFVADWAVAKSNDVLNGQFGRGRCEECHRTIEIQPAGAVQRLDVGIPPPVVEQLLAPLPAPVLPDRRTWTIEPPVLTSLWMPKAYFTHARHTNLPCAECHAAKTSNSSADVLMPGIAVCQSCHGGEKATDRVPTTCVSCHRYHRKDLAPGKPAGTPARAAAHALPPTTLAGALPLWEKP